MFTRALISTAMIAFLSIGCATKKPSNDQDAGAASGANDGLSLDLNGDSDSRTAGGLKTIFFSVDSSNLQGVSQETARSNADFLKQNRNVDVQIEGHCDERGGRQYNLALGERRAKAVRDYLVALGVESKRISVVSYGNERPVAEGSNESAWSQNRRANFVVTSK